MSKEKSNSTNGGVGLLGLLMILFIGLKLTNYIDWSWWWVLSPMLIPLSIAGFLLLVLGLFEYLNRK